MEVTPVARPCHESIPRSSYTYRKHLSRNPSINQSQSSHSAYLTLENRVSPYKEPPHRLTYPSLPCFLLPLLTIKLTLTQTPPGRGSTAVRRCAPPSHGYAPLNKRTRKLITELLVLSLDRAEKAEVAWAPGYEHRKISVAHENILSMYLKIELPKIFVNIY